MKLKLTLLVTIVSTLFITSCKNNTIDAGVDTAQSESGTTEINESEDLFDNNKFIDKYNQYINFQNYTHSRINDSYKDYYKYYDTKKELKKGNSPKIYNNIGSGAQTLKDAIAIQPTVSQLDSPAQALYQSVITLDSVLNLSKFYYKKEEYLNDNFAKAKELNALVEPAFEEYFKNYSLFAEQIGTIEDQLTERDLKSLKEKGADIYYNLLLATVTSEKLYNYLLTDIDNNFKNLSVEKIDALVNEFKVPVDALEQLSLDKAKVESQMDTFKRSILPNFLDVSYELIRHTNLFKERLQKNNWKTSITHPSIPDNGTIEKIDKIYNELIKKYNSTL